MGSSRRFSIPNSRALANTRSRVSLDRACGPADGGGDFRYPPVSIPILRWQYPRRTHGSQNPSIERAIGPHRGDFRKSSPTLDNLAAQIEDQALLRSAASSSKKTRRTATVAGDEVPHLRHDVVPGSRRLQFRFWYTRVTATQKLHRMGTPRLPYIWICRSGAQGADRVIQTEMSSS